MCFTNRIFFVFDSFILCTLKYLFYIVVESIKFYGYLLSFIIEFIELFNLHCLTILKVISNFHYLKNNETRFSARELSHLKQYFEVGKLEPPALIIVLIVL